MISLLLSIALLILGYFIYGRVVERIFGADSNRPTPAQTMADGVDYVSMPTWKIFLIQFLNIAGLGPIFGAVAGAMWGPLAFLWIVFGCILAGGVHDYFSGMLSLRHDGKSIAEVSGHYLGNGVRQFMRAFTVILMIIVGAVFLLGPARILTGMDGGLLGTGGWTALILLYYILSTILPIDKVIGKLYPLFGLALLIMAFGLLGVLLFGDLPLPELNVARLTNMHSDAGAFPVFPMLFITIACGAVSGFHATQSPLMARCIRNEKQGKGIFFGAMVVEGIVALIWAAISMCFFGGVTELNDVMSANNNNAAWAVNEITSSSLGQIGGILALLGVVAAPITSGDTSFRSARLIIADFLKLKQKTLKNRLLISIPIFLVGFALTLIDFGVIWRYFAWTNQTLATIVLWTITVYLKTHKLPYVIALVPATFMTAVVSSYILVAPEGFQLPVDLSIVTGCVLAGILCAWVIIKDTSTSLETGTV